MNTGRGRCATRSTSMSSAAATSRGLPEISCGKRASRAAASGRFATSTARAPRIRCTKSADPSRTSGSWEAQEIGRPGAQTFGLNATNGLYAGWGGCAPRGVRGFPVYRPEHWAFAGTGLYYGDLLGAEGHAFGYEVDGLDYLIRGGLPEPSATSGAPEGLQILALGLSSLKEEPIHRLASTIDSCPMTMRNSWPRFWWATAAMRRSSE